MGMFPRDQLFSHKAKLRCKESSLIGHIMQKYTCYLFTKEKSKQSYLWIESIFEAQNICFGREIAGTSLGTIPIISAL